MQLTKFVHSCVLVETDQSTALFDPGIMSEQALDNTIITKLDDIFITHSHTDHNSLSAISKLVSQFPDVRITASAPVVSQLAEANLLASSITPEEAEIFESRHQAGGKLFTTPEQIGIHYLNVFTHPGDSHSFKETKSILALPVTAPWGSTVNAVKLGLKLQPRYILPIHDWHWQDAARLNTYDQLEAIFAEAGITFLKPETGVPIDIPPSRKQGAKLKKAKIYN